MEDIQIIERIHRLVDEEHRLREHGDGIDKADAARLRYLEVGLDQCWDLLRQRRARRQAGEDPEESDVRDAGTVEGYRQ